MDNRSQLIQEGTVICGTHQPEALIPAFLAELKRVNEDLLALHIDGSWRTSYGRYQHLWAEINRHMIVMPDYDESEASDVDLEALFEVLNELAPDGYWFGGHDFDTSDYGYWLVEERE